MRRRRGTLTAEDHADWARFSDTITPLAGTPLAGTPLVGRQPVPRPVAAPPPAAVLPPWPKAVATRPAARPPQSAVSIGGQPGGLDSSTWERFRGGKLSTVRRLDLHGMTAQRAFHSLTSFLRAAHADRLRCVEIVTGRGSGDGGGVIRREFPMWLNLPDIRPLLLAAAHPHAANTGSVRLLLRRVR